MLRRGQQSSWSGLLLCQPNLSGSGSQKAALQYHTLVSSNCSLELWVEAAIHLCTEVLLLKLWQLV